MPQWLGRHKWLWLTAAVMIIGLIAFAACKDDKKEGKTPTPGGSPAAEGPLKIGYLLDFTGALASFGPDEENAIKLAVGQINDAGGVLGEDVVLARGDSGTDKDIAVAESKLVEDLGFEKVCTMYVNNAYGLGLSENFATAFEAAGGTVTAQISHPDQTAATTYESELTQCVADDPEALVAISYQVGQAQVYLKEALEKAIIDTFVFVDGTRDAKMFEALGWAEFDGLKGTSPGALPPSDFTTKFNEQYTAEYGSLDKVPFTREASEAGLVISPAAG